MTQVVVWVYRAVYMVTVAFFGVMVSPAEASWRAVALAVYPLSFLAQFSLVLLTGLTRRPLRWPVWVVTAACCVGYGSLGWLMAGSPFVLHVLRTLSPDAMVVEEGRGVIASGQAVVMTFLWLLTFPVVHELESALNRLGRSR
jgi:predicted membrane metal-binding protein